MVKKEEDEFLAVGKIAKEQTDQMDNFPVTLDGGGEIIDDRDYVDKMFKDFIPGHGTVNKTVHGHMCQGNEVPNLSKSSLAVLFNYRTKRTQGKRDPLGGNHILLIPTDKDPIPIPIHLARKFALNILKLMDGIDQTCKDNEIDISPPGLEKG